MGLLTGELSQGLIAIDHDGASCDDLILKLSDCRTVEEALPKTVKFTSNRPGRYQVLYRVSETYWKFFKTFKISTEKKDEDGKDEQLELRWNGCQSCLPPSTHPLTGGYEWVEFVDIPEVPEWVVNLMIVENQSLKETKMNKELPRQDLSLSELEEIVKSISKEHWDDYSAWVKIGMGIHRATEGSNCGLALWENYSQQSEKYRNGDCVKKWGSFKKDGVGIGSLYFFADKVLTSADLRTKVRTKVRAGETSIQQEIEGYVRTADYYDEKERLLSAGDLEVEDYLPQELANQVKKRADTLGVSSNVFSLPILAAASSFLHTDTSLVIGEHLTIPPVLFCGIVAPPSSRKSAVSKSVTQAIYQVQARAVNKFDEDEEKYAYACEQFETLKNKGTATEKDRPKPPILTHYYMEDVTIEAVAQKLALQAKDNKGTLLLNDELAKFFEFDRYKGGAGTEKQKWLENYDRSPWKIDRAGKKTIFIHKPQVSIYGGIQPKVLQNLLKDGNDPDGLWSRFLFFKYEGYKYVPLTRSSGKEDELKIYFQGLYEYLERLPGISYELDDSALNLLNAFGKELFDKTEEQEDPFWKNYLGKGVSAVGRIALVLHLIHSYERNSNIIPSLTVSFDIVRKAIILYQMYLAHFAMIHIECGAALGKLTDKQILVINYLKKNNSSASLRDIYSNVKINGKKLTSKEANEIVINLEEQKIVLRETTKKGSTIITLINHKTTSSPSSFSFSPHVSPQSADNLESSHSIVLDVRTVSPQVRPQSTGDNLTTDNDYWKKKEPTFTIEERILDKSSLPQESPQESYEEIRDENDKLVKTIRRRSLKSLGIPVVDWSTTLASNVH